MLPPSVAGIGGRQALGDHQRRPVSTQRPREVPLGYQRVAHLAVTDRQVALPLGLAGIGRCQALGDRQRRPVGAQRPREVPLGHQPVAHLLVAGQQVALPLGLPGIGRRQAFKNLLCALEKREAQTNTCDVFQGIPELEKVVGAKLAGDRRYLPRQLEQGECPGESSVGGLGLTRQQVLGQGAGSTGKLQPRIIARCLPAEAGQGGHKGPDFQPRIIGRCPRPIVRPDEVIHQLRLTQRVFRRQGLQMIGKHGMQCPPTPGIAKVSSLHRRSELRMGKVPLRLGAALDQMGAQAAAQSGEGEVTPGLATDLGQQDLQVRLAPAAAAERHQVDQSVRPGSAVQFLRPRQEIAVEGLDLGRQVLGHCHEQGTQALPGRIARQAMGPGEVVGVEQQQFVERQLQPERDAGGGLTVGAELLRQTVAHRRGQGLVVASAEGVGDLLGLAAVERRQCQGGHARTLFQRGAGAAGDRGGDEPGIGWPEFGEPGEVLGGRGGLELIQCIEQADDAPLHRGAAEQGGEGLLQLVGLGQSLRRIGDLECGGELADPAPQQVLDPGGAVADAGGVSEQQQVLLGQLPVELGEQGALAGPGRAGEAGTPGGIRFSR